jgi:hypothetical protein
LWIRPELRSTSFDFKWPRQLAPAYPAIPASFPQCAVPHHVLASAPLHRYCSRGRARSSVGEHLPSKSKTTFSGIITVPSTIDFIGDFSQESSGKITNQRKKWRTVYKKQYTKVSGKTTCLLLGNTTTNGIFYTFVYWLEGHFSQFAFP